MSDKIEPRSNWSNVDPYDLETLRELIQIVMEYERTTGKEITATQLRAALRRPH